MASLQVFQVYVAQLTINLDKSLQYTEANVLENTRKKKKKEKEKEKKKSKKTNLMTFMTVGVFLGVFVVCNWYFGN